MAPRPSSPTSLLWAHQLKREHGYLLQRMQNLEAKNENHDSRLTAAESATSTKSNQEIEGLAEQVKALNEAGVEKRIADMEKNVAEKLDDVQAESEAHTIQIASLQNDTQMAEDERKKAAGKDKVLLKRIDEVETHLKKYEKALGQIGKRPDESRFEQIKGQLEGLTKEVKQEGEQTKWLQESITALESANAELLKANEKLDREISKMAAKQAANDQKRAQKSNAAEDSQATAGAEDEDSPSRKKSHKWVGGGADRDIIRMGSGFVGKSKTTQKSPQSTLKAPPAREQPKKNLAPPGPKKKPQPPALKPQRFIPNDSGSPKKSHRWAGGGADKDIIQSGVSFSVDGKRRRSGDAEPEAARKKPLRLSEGDADGDTIRAASASSSKLQPSNIARIKSEFAKPSRRSIPQAEGDEVVVRSGKGWLEVLEGEVEETSTGPPPPKRKRGRPRKDEVAPQVTEDDLTQGRATRRGAPQQPQEQEQAQAEPQRSRTSLAEEILGDLYHEKTAQDIVTVDLDLSRPKLERLKEILERNPKARKDIDELAREANRPQPAAKKRTAGFAFGADGSEDDDEAANRQRIKRIKREESPESSTDVLDRIPKVYSSPGRSQLDDTVAVTSQSQAAPRKVRRQIVQPDDIAAS